MVQSPHFFTPETYRFSFRHRDLPKPDYSMMAGDSEGRREFVVKTRLRWVDIRDGKCPDSGWLTYNLHGDFPRIFHDFLMIFQWCSNDFPMIFPMMFQWFSWMTRGYPAVREQPENHPGRWVFFPAVNHHVARLLFIARKTFKTNVQHTTE